MIFANPVFLYGFFALLIPVIIHLFNFRRYKTVYFPNLQLLRSIQVKSKKKSKLKNLLILLIRLLIISSLVIAFAQPYFPSGVSPVKFENESAVCVYIDNSFSMNSGNTTERLLEDAYNKARDIIESFKPSDKFQLLTNNLEGQHQRLVSMETALSYLDEVQTTPDVVSLSSVVERFNDQLKTSNATNKLIYIISDFQKVIADIGNIKTDSMVYVYFIPVQEEYVSNLYIDSCWFASPVILKGFESVINVRVKNNGDKPFNKVPLKFLEGGLQKGISNFSVEPGGEIVKEIPFTSDIHGIRTGEVRIADFPVVFDDSWYVSYTVPEKVNILVINDQTESKYLNALYSEDPLFNYSNTNINSIDYGNLPVFQLVVLNGLEAIPSGLSQELIRIVEAGGTVIVVPPELDDIQSYNNFLNQCNHNGFLPLKETDSRIGSLNLNHRVFQDVFEETPSNADLPLVSRYYPQAGRGFNNEVLVSMVGGEPFLSLSAKGKGEVYVLSSSLNSQSGGFPEHPIFVPVFYNIARFSGKSGFIQYTIGSPDPVIADLNIDMKRETLKIKDTQSDYEFIPETASMNDKTELFFHNRFKKSGNYLIMKQTDTVGVLSVNYNRSESDLTVFSIDDLKELASQNIDAGISIIDFGNKPVKSVLEDINKGTRLWKLFVIFALLLLAIETLVIRLWK